MWRLLVFAGLLATAVGLPEDAEAAASSVKVASIEARKDDGPAAESPAKRSPISATGVYGASQGAPHGQYVVRQGDDVQELAPEYLALLQQYLEAQQQRQHQQQQQQHHHQQQQQQQHAPPAYGPYNKHPQGIPLEVEQYHVETSPRRPVPVHQPQQLYYPVEEPQPQPQPQPQHHAPPPPPPPPPQHHQRQHQVVAAEPEQLRYHQVIPIQYGYEDEQQIQAQQQTPESIVRAQAQAEAQALAFQKIAQASHRKHQDSALEQIRIVNEKYRSEQSALEQISRGEQVSEAGRKERVEPKDPESAYKARLKAQATALVAEQRRAHEAAEYKAHADAILKLQAQQRAHLRAQEEAHHYALNFEKNQQRAQAQAQAIANAQALALYKAHQQARNKAQGEAKQAARAQHEARKLDPKSAPVVQYLLPNNVPLPAPEVYLPEAAKALRADAAAAAAAAAQQKRLKKPQHLKHQLLIEELDPQLLRRGPGKHEEQQQYVLVDADYYRKAQQQQQHHQQRPLLRQNEYQGLEEVSPRPHYQQQYQQIDPDKLALLVPVEHQGLGQGP